MTPSPQPAPARLEPDAGLLERCRQGERAAQRELYDAYRDRVYSIALHYLGEEAGAADVTQQVFLKVFRTIGGFRGEARLTTWLYRIVVNACIDERRRGRRLVFFGTPPRTVAQRPAPEAAGDEDERETVRCAVERLPPKLRMVILLRYFDDLSYDEIAGALGCRAGTVASRLNRAHAALARELRGEVPA